MKHIVSFLSSTRLMAILLTIFGIAIATATFIENDFGTDVARSVVYNARWFELLLLLGVVNIIGVVLKLKMYSRSKLTLLIFHISFVIIILGAGLSRYFGREGIMHIRESEISDKWYSNQAHIGIYVQDQNHSFFKAYPVTFSSFGGNKVKRSLRFEGHSIKFKILEYIAKAEKTLEYSREGKPRIHVVTSSSEGREEVILSQGQTLKSERGLFSFKSREPELQGEEAVQFFIRDGSLYFLAPFDVSSVSMADQSIVNYSAGMAHLFVPATLYYFDSIPIMLKQFIPNAIIGIQPASDRNSEAFSALRIKVTCDGVSESLIVFGRKEEPGNPYSIHINGTKIGMTYGSQEKQLPFHLRLNDFIIKRYPGSESPSWFESNVQLIDTDKKVDQERRIYMNHILKHRGFRFYQSSYDSDEKGTVLSVNRDSMGSTITYLGYFLLALGMLLSLINRKSRFATLAGAEVKSSLASKAILIGSLIMLSEGIFAQASQANQGELPAIRKETATNFGSILVQDNGGRIEPLNTLASEVLRKVCRKEQFKGQQPDQVLLGMWVYPDSWQHEKMIRVSHPEIQKILLLDSKYAAFVDFFASDMYGGYVLHDLVENAYRKKPAYRSKFDNELIRVDERLNICYLLYTGTLFKIFPDPDDSTFHWHSPVTAGEVFSGKDSLFAQHILSYLAEELQKSQESGNYDIPDEMIKAIKIFQLNYGKEIAISQNRIKAETFYNKSNLFSQITRIYLLVGLLLLFIQFIHFFIPRFNLRWFLVPAVVALILFFILHTATLVLRWYIAGHAPWSNGYEALTFIAWATMLAGLIFSRRSAITISSTAVLAALILQTAHLSWMDPQITNLVPVLQSYWLVIHVAVITASYGFLGLGALLAAINLLLMFFHSAKNYNHINEQIATLSGIIEMTLIAGLYLLTIGTFLGGVWANESWGRYWAWDPKETWALVTVIVYAVILHLRLVPGLKGRVLFNILALIGFSSVIMTYFGVNYYLSGLHSYAKGDPLPVPPAVYYSITVVVIISILAAFNQARLKRIKT